MLVLITTLKACTQWNNNACAVDFFHKMRWTKFKLIALCSSYSPCLIFIPYLSAVPSCSRLSMIALSLLFILFMLQTSLCSQVFMEASKDRDLDKNWVCVAQLTCDTLIILKKKNKKDFCGACAIKNKLKERKSPNPTLREFGDQLWLSRAFCWPYKFWNNPNYLWLVGHDEVIWGQCIYCTA